MSSSSTDGRPAFLSADRGAWVRLAVVLAFAVTALLGPLLSPLVGSTSAQFTDSTQVDVTLTVPSPYPSP